MSRPAAYSASRYLLATRPVAAGALDRGVFDRLARELGSGPPRPRVLEIGAGAGTMVARALEWNLFSAADYTLLDLDAECLATARRWLADWARQTGRGCLERGTDLCLGPVTVRFVQAELGGHLDQLPLLAHGKVDLLVANAFLDLVDVPAFLPALLSLIGDGGLFWFTINFDGETIFVPESPLDAPLMAAYHRDMDQRVRHGRPAGDSKTGRRLFGHLGRAGAEVLAAGSSDWVVCPERGRYAGDEAYFLHHIVDTISGALSVRPEIDGAGLAAWVELRHQQIERGELCYIAHQLDFVGRPR
jgi:SAM-dependent methyltransferase